MIVGVNEFVTDEPELDDSDCSRSARTPSASSAQRLAADARRRATTRSCARGSTRSRAAARDDARTSVPHILDCARAYCTLYEIRAALEDVFGAYREPVFF